MDKLIAGQTLQKRPHCPRWTGPPGHPDDAADPPDLGALGDAGHVPGDQESRHGAGGGPGALLDVHRVRRAEARGRAGSDGRRRVLRAGPPGHID